MHLIVCALWFTAVGLAQESGMKSAVHSSGIEFQHPAAWQTQQDGALLAMVPADAARDEKGQPLELVLLGAEGAAGISSPDDPKVIEYLQTQLGQMFQGLQRTGAVQAVPIPLGKGARVSFESTGPGGISISQNVYVILHQQTGIFLAHIARKDLAARRDPMVRSIFASFKAAKGGTDADLFHTWRRENYTRSADLNASISNSTYLYYKFLPDGTVLYSSKSHTFGDTAGLSVTVQSDAQSGITRGKYSARGGVLTMSWPNGERETYQYNVFTSTIDGSRNLGLLAPGAQKKTYFTLYE